MSIIEGFLWGYFLGQEIATFIYIIQNLKK